ncbi:MAG: dockerin type I repeat-containing protein [Muribaculaceae bacterium]|nr:dockerin type I repeat-containing protein [Muribaculaceae bacterium]
MKKIIFILVLAFATLQASADAFGYLKFNLSGSNEQAFAANGVKITFDNGNAIVTLADGTTSTLTLADINYFYFSDDAGTNLLKGDVNGDGEISVADITALVNIVLSSEQLTDPDLFYRADVNSDGEIGIADITSLVNLVMEQN